jgi:hypothetical protein
MKSSRRDLLVTGAAALAARKIWGQDSSAAAGEPAWKHLFPPGFRNERI